MQKLQKINIGWNLRDPKMLRDEELFRIFNEWISENGDEVLIDVADYKHLHHGPTTILIGHSANYFLETEDQRKSLVYARKQPQDGDLSKRLTLTLRSSLNCCIKLENHPELQGRVKFDGGEVQFVANDRLQAANTEENIQCLQQHLSPILDTLYGPQKYTFECANQPEDRLAVTARTTSATDISDLIVKLK